MTTIASIPGIRWELMIGDPTPLAWATVAAYLLAAVGCAACALRADLIFKSPPIRLHRFIWWFLCGLLLFLGVNKQLDLQTPFTRAIKYFAWHEGLYDLGKRSQKYFIFGLAAISLGGIGWALWKVRRDWRRYIILALGALFIVRFVVVRAAGFYGVWVPSMSFLPAGMKINWLLELIGALTIGLSAYLNIRFSKKKRAK